MSARITVNCCRKIGRPKFSSASAGLSIEFDVADDLSAEIRSAMIDSAFDECWAAVAGELAELTSDDDAREPEPEPEPEPSRNGRRDDRDDRDDRRPERENRWSDGRGTRDAREPRRRDDRDRDERRPSRDDDRRSSRAPRTGKELFGWLKDEEKAGARGLFRAIAQWGKSVGYPEQFADWSADEVADGYDEARHRMARRNGDDR